MLIFNRTPYGQEHKLVVLTVSKPKIKGVEVLSFKEEFEHYKSMCTGKYAKWATKEGFQLEYNSSWKDLQVAYFIYCNDQVLCDLIKTKLNVIEECL